MKKTLSTLLSILFCTITFAQSTLQRINYQSVAKDLNGDLLMNQALTIQFSVISDLATLAINWQETHSVTTNDDAWSQSFATGVQDNDDKRNFYNEVRAVRAF